MADLIKEFPVQKQEVSVQFRRLYAKSLVEGQVFDNVIELNAYLNNPARYPGQIATCIENLETIYILNASRDAWVSVKGSGGGAYMEIQFENTQEFEIEHNIGKYPNVQIIVGGKVCMADVEHLDTETVGISFAKPYTGVVVLS
jgi:hypothetical protein